MVVILFWRSKGSSDENIMPPAISNHTITPKLRFLVLKQE